MTPAPKSNIDYNFYKDIAKQPKGEGITKCLSCGTCSSTCQVFSVNPAYNPRKLIQKAVLGLKDEVLKSEKRESEKRKKRVGLDLRFQSVF